MTGYFPPRRAVSLAFSSKAAISASSCERPVVAHLLLRLEDAAVVVRHDAHEVRHPFLPGRQDLLGALAAGQLRVAQHEPVHQLRLLGIFQLVQADHLLVAALGEGAPLVEHVGDAARHAGGEVAAAAADDHHAPAGHVLAAVIADPFDDRVGAAVADGEALAGDAAEEGLAGGGAVERHVADEDVLLGGEGRLLRRVDDDPAAREPLADVVVGVPFQRQRHAARDEGAEALPGGAGELQLDGVVGQPVRTVLPRDLAAGDGADDAVDVADRERRRNLLAARDGRLAQRQDGGHVERVLEAVVLVERLVASHLGTDLRLVEDLREVEPARLPVVDRRLHLQMLGVADHLVHACGSRAPPSARGPRWPRSA